MREYCEDCKRERPADYGDVQLVRASTLLDPPEYEWICFNCQSRWDEEPEPGEEELWRYRGYISD